MISMEKDTNNFEPTEKTYRGGIAILYRKNGGLLQFLVVQNSGTGNITFVSGAKEESDRSEMDALNRELQEELELSEAVELQQTEVRHEFVFGPKKKDRAGSHGSYQVFLADVSGISDSITHTEELREIKWLSKDEVLDTLSFSDLKEVFIKAIENLS